MNSLESTYTTDKKDSDTSVKKTIKKIVLATGVLAAGLGAGYAAHKLIGANAGSDSNSDSKRLVPIDEASPNAKRLTQADIDLLPKVVQERLKNEFIAEKGQPRSHGAYVVGGAVKGGAYGSIPGTIIGPGIVLYNNAKNAITAGKTLSGSKLSRYVIPFLKSTKFKPLAKAGLKGGGVTTLIGAIAGGISGHFDYVNREKDFVNSRYRIEP